ncbi:50S ribosomal protein L25/general stress protein Ctc [Corynebacterium caspium]|uniref:50S ribosomal protein L25/general stress protein Ctc n=1 Tax=Corynebacterium caspium TaxID=234828 RepID=UPI00035EE8C0|nr:50S ribosomal protein L25/general stress protein Ctc [Corynebacterium caspium]WKD59583.1 General stress protein CTC [Corynebacterium caspium DSM 44850]
MASYPTIEGKERKEFGKGAARRLRREWQIPGVIYSAGMETLHFSVGRLEMTKIIRKNGINAVIQMDIEGEKHLTMVKHVDQNPLTLDIDHLDLYAIKRGEKVEVEVPVVLVGEPAAGTIAIQNMDLVLIESDVMEIPEEITIDITDLEVDTQILASDLKLPSSAVLIGEAEDVFVSITWPDSESDSESETTAADAAEDAENDAE